MKKLINISTKVLLLFLLLIFGVYCAFCIFVEGTLPQFQTIYATYNSFYKNVNEPTFMEELPESATDKKYYHHIYPFNEKNGYGATIGIEEYETSKAYCLQNKWNYINKLLSHKTINGETVEMTDAERAEVLAQWNIYSMDDASTPEPDVIAAFERHDVDYFHKLAQEDINSGNYHFIWCWEDNISPHPQIHCAIYNNETHEIIEISCTTKTIG